MNSITFGAGTETACIICDAPFVHSQQLRFDTEPDSDSDTEQTSGLPA